MASSVKEVGNGTKQDGRGQQDAQHEGKDQRGGQGEREEGLRPTNPQHAPQKPQGAAAWRRQGLRQREAGGTKEHIGRGWAKCGNLFVGREGKETGK